MKKSKWWVAAIAATLAVGLVAEGAATAGVSKAGTTRGVTKSTIKVGGLLSAVLFGDAVKGAQARFDRENEKGVFGRKIDLASIGDDKFDPNVNIQEARRLVTQEQVFALVPTVSVVLSSGDFLAQQKVPFLGWGISAAFCESEYAYGWSGCVGGGGSSTPKFSDTLPVSVLAKSLGKPTKGLTVAIIGDDTDAARVGNQTQESAAKSLGVKVSYNKSTVPAPPATVGDFTPFVQEIMTSNEGGPPDMVELFFAGIPSTLGLLNGLRDAGFKGPILNTQTYDTRLAGAADTGGVLVQFGAFETADTVPGVKQMVDDLDTAGAPKTVLSAGGWLAADMFIAIIKKVGKNLTVENFQKVANKFTYKIKGLVGPTPLGDKPRPTPCGTYVTSNGVAYDVTVPYSCAKALPYKS